MKLTLGPFIVVLIGKDDREKLRHTNRIDLAEMLDPIDTMPMRRQEMRERGR